MRRASWAALWTVFATLACGTGPGAPTTEFLVQAVDTIITGESGALMRPTEVTIGPSGRVFITDVGATQILVFSPEGLPLDSLGRNGSGPGEFRSPRGMAVLGDSLRVFDPRNGIVHVWTVAGSFVRSYRSPHEAFSGAVAFGADGGALIATDGSDSTLLLRIDPHGEPIRRFAAPVAPAPRIWDFGAMKQELFDGKIPPVFRNIGRPVPARDGGTWFLLTAEGAIRRYDAGDSLRWERGLDEPELTDIRAHFFEAARADSNPAHLVLLDHFVAGQEVGEQLWVLLGGGEEASATFLLLGPDGTVQQRVRVPGVLGSRAFAVDPARRVLYLLGTQDAALYRVALPNGLVLGTGDRS